MKTKERGIKLHFATRKAAREYVSKFGKGRVAKEQPRKGRVLKWAVIL